MRKFLPIPLGQLGVGLFWMSIAFLVFWGITSMSAAETGSVGPATFPRILAISLSILVIAYWFQSRKAETTSFFETTDKRDALKAVFLVALAFAAAYLWESLGALIILLVLSFVELRWIEGFGWLKVFVVGAVLSFGTWLLFTLLLGVPLPLGLLIRFY